MTDDIKEKAPVWFPVAPIVVFVCVYCVLLLGGKIVSWLKLTNDFSIPYYLNYVIGILLAIVGLAFFVWGFAQLKPAAAIGFAKKLRDTGAYGLTRNPMYFGLNAVLWGIGLTLGKFSVLIAAFIWSLLNFLSVTLWEEKQMLGKFGDEYIDYKKRVPRFIPLKFRR